MRKTTRIRGKNTVMVAYKIDEDLINMFRSTTAFNGVNMSDVVEECIKAYVVKHKAAINSKMKTFFDTKSIEKLIENDKGI